MKELFDNKDKGAQFSDCRKFRYALWRIWDRTKPMVMFIGLNPSTANELSDDPTIRRVISFAKRWGYGGVYMMNCFPFVTAFPEELCLNDFAQNINDKLLIDISKKCHEVIFAWGNFEAVTNHKRDAVLINMFPDAMCLGKNKSGSPKHPLYIKSDALLIKYSDK